MNGIVVFILGFVAGVVLIIVAACISVEGESPPIHFKKSAEKQPNEIANFNSDIMNRHILNDTIFYLLIYYMSGFMAADEIKAYLTNAVKLGVNKDYLTLIKTKTNANAEVVAQLLYNDIMEKFKEGE